MTGPISERLDVALRRRGAGAIVARRYRLATKLGEGAMASVWLAQDLSLDAPCAVKIVNDELAQKDEMRARFAREAKVAAQLRTPHVVRVFDHGEWDGTFYLAMELLEGEDLATRLDRVGALAPDSAYRLVAHVARALMEAQTTGIIHRDLKPENVFLVQDYGEEIAKVLDFGIARHDLWSLRGTETRTGSFLGTPFYVSPEQARGRRVDHRSDLWSLGVVAFQCLTGRPPFEAEGLGELMGLILYEPLPKPTAYNPALAPAVDTWWARACARDPDQRFESAKELADELAGALGLEAVVNVNTIAAARISEPPGQPVSSGVFTTERPSADVGLGRIFRPGDSPALPPHQTDVSSVRVRSPGTRLPAGAPRGRVPWRRVAVGAGLAALAAVAALFALRAREDIPAAQVVEIRPSAVAGPSAESQTHQETPEPGPAVDAPEVSAKLPPVEISGSASRATAAPSVQGGLARPAPIRSRVPYRAPARPRRSQPKPEPAEHDLDRPNYGI